MSERETTKTRTTGKPNLFTNGVLQRKCASCSNHMMAGGKCEGCEKRGGLLQRKSNGHSEWSEIPAIVHDVLGTPGQPLDAGTRAFFEPRFGQDFSSVRVHTDAKAVESARALNALAYTVGRDLVFGGGQYAPQTMVGRRLMAHELTHSLQQTSDRHEQMQSKLRIGSATDTFEQEADRVADSVTGNRNEAVVGVSAVSIAVQRACGPAEIGEPERCEFATGDVTGPRYLFRVNCDEFARGNELDLRADATTIVQGEIVEIHGLASADGNPSFNRHLSCARALRAKQVIEEVLAERGVTATVRVFNHGAVSGDSTLMRSVVLVRNDPELTLSPTPEPRPPRIYPTVRVWVNSFIPHERIEGPPGSECFSGDNRGFSNNQSASSRTHQAIEVRAGESSPTASIRRIGTTHEVDCDTGGVIDSDTASEDDLSNGAIIGQRTSAQADVFFSADASNPLVAFAPAINLEAEFHLNLVSRRCIFEIEHDGFPAYEAYIAADGVPGIPVYTYDPRDAGEGISALFSPMDKSALRQISF